MESPQYIEQALRTESVPTSVVIEKTSLHAILSLAIAAAGIADLAKRRIYYGSPIPQEKLLGHLDVVHKMGGYLDGMASQQMDMDNPAPSHTYSYLADHLKSLDLAHINVRLLHSALGCFTESGELLEPILAQFEGKPLDKVNFGEEVGDIEWYQAIGFDETGVTEATCREKNIAKLRKRYPQKFDAVSAVNRDLVAERVVLEGNDTLDEDQ